MKKIIALTLLAVLFLTACGDKGEKFIGVWNSDYECGSEPKANARRRPRITEYCAILTIIKLDTQFFTTLEYKNSYEGKAYITKRSRKLAELKGEILITDMSELGPKTAPITYNKKDNTLLVNTKYKFKKVSD